MKKKILTLMIIASFSFAGCEDDSDEASTIVLKEVPTEIRAYVDEHFPGQTVSQAILRQDDQIFRYELLLDNFIELEFNSEKVVIEIEGQSQLPDSVIPENILSYVESNYQDHYITAWELETGYQQIQLDNQIEIEFNLEGNFLRIDS